MHMQLLEQLAELGESERKRAETVVENLSTLGSQGENLAAVAHDARNMVTALDLYCDLLQEPGVLGEPFTHYGSELKLVAAASRRLVDKLAGLDPEETQDEDALSRTQLEKLAIESSAHNQRSQSKRWHSVPSKTIENLAAETLYNRNLLSAVAGPAVSVTVNVEGAAQPVQMSGEDLTRILVNLVKNAAEAMAGVGRIHINLWESCGEPGNAPWLTLNVEDNGPGIPDRLLSTVFEPGQSAHRNSAALVRPDQWPVAHRGLGLSITRSIVEAAGGFIHAANRDPVGACIQIELPVQACQRAHS